LGLDPSDGASYQERGGLLRKWIQEGVLVADRDPCLYVYAIDYSLPTSSLAMGAEQRARFLGLMALGRLHPFSDGVVLPHEKTFPKVVDDRYRLLEATRTNLESIFLLYSDPERVMESSRRGPISHPSLVSRRSRASSMRFTGFPIWRFSYGSSSCSTDSAPSSLTVITVTRHLCGTGAKGRATRNKCLGPGGR
jgi:hypothetical protein